MRWTGLLEPRFSEDYTFSVPKEGIRLWLGGQLVLNGTGRNLKATLPLEAGQKLPIKIEFFGPKGAPAIMQWQSLSQPLEAIAATQLYPAREALPTVSLTASTIKPQEGDIVVFTIKREGSNAALALPYDIGGTAVTGQDFKPLSGTAMLAAGAAKTEFTLETLEDKIGEPDKSIQISLRQSALYNVNGPPLSLELRDNDMPPAGAGTGLTVEYFAGPDFTDSKGTQISKTLDYNWDKETPYQGLDTKGYSIRWTGQIEPLFTETYTLSADASFYGGAKVWIDNVLVLDTVAKDGKKAGEVALTAGEKHNLRVELINKKVYGAKIRLSWKSSSQFQQIVPMSQLFSLAKEYIDLLHKS